MNLNETPGNMTETLPDALEATAKRFLLTADEALNRALRTDDNDFENFADYCEVARQMYAFASIPVPKLGTGAQFLTRQDIEEMRSPGSSLMMPLPPPPMAPPYVVKDFGDRLIIQKRDESGQFSDVAEVPVKQQ